MGFVSLWVSWKARQYVSKCVALSLLINGCCERMKAPEISQLQPLSACAAMPGCGAGLAWTEHGNCCCLSPFLGAPLSAGMMLTRDDAEDDV